MNGVVRYGDCREIMRGWIERGVRAQMCVTSPPYFGLRDYGIAGQLGMEETPDAYVASLVEVFRLVRDVLLDDGTLWLNMGDSYNGSGKGGVFSEASAKQATNVGANINRPTRLDSLKPKDLIGIPWRVAFALQSDGWYLRQDIIWSKPNPMPESVRDRCTKAHEYLFMLSKRTKYYYDLDAIKEPGITNDLRRPYGSKGAWDLDGRPKEQQHGGEPRADKQRGHGRRYDGFNDRWDKMSREEQCSTMRNKRSVWSVAPRPYKGAHFATFPPQLIEPCILAGSRVGSIILDPFLGSGTTAQVALQHGRRYLGCELNPAYAALINERVAKFTPIPVAAD